MGYDKRCILHERVWVGECRRAVVVLGDGRAGDDEGGRDVEPFFLELVRGEDVDGEIGDEEDVPELQSGFFCFTVVV